MLIIFFIVIAVLALLIALPFRGPILASIVLAYIFYPIYNWLHRKIKMKNTAALIISLVIILLLVIPAGIMTYYISREASIGYILLKQKIAKSGFLKGSCEDLFCNLFKSIKSAISKPEARFYIESSLNSLTSKLAQGTFNFIFSIPARVLELFLTFFFTFFLLRDGKAVVEKIKASAPLKTAHKTEVLKQVDGIIYAVVYGFFIIAVVEGTIGAITFNLFGVASPVLWGLVIAFLTFVPLIGAAVVWVPAAIIQAMHGNVANTIGIIAGGMVISYIDNFVKPKVIGDKAKVHPAIILLGLLGGLKLLGFIGIVVGPIILSVFITLAKTFLKNK